MSDIKGALSKEIDIKGFVKKLDSWFLSLFSWEHMKLIVLALVLMFTIAPIYIFYLRLCLPDNVYLFDYSVDQVMYFARRVTVLAGYILLRRVISKELNIRTLIRENIPQVLFILLALWIFLTCAIRGLTVWDLHATGELLHEDMISFVLYALFFTVCVSMLREPKYKLLVVNAYTVVSVMLALLTLFDIYVFELEQFHKGEGISSVFFHFNYYGYYLTMGILLSAVMFISSVSRIRGYLYFMSFMLQSFVLIKNDTFGCYLGVIVGLVFVIIAKKASGGKFSLTSFAALGAFGVLSVAMSLGSADVGSNFTSMYNDVGKIANNEDAGTVGTGRGNLWIETVKLIKERPVIGHGARTFAYKFKHDLETKMERPHNELLQYAGWYGIPAAVIYFFAVASVYLKAVFRRLSLDSVTLACLAAAFGYFASSMVGLTVYNTAPYFYIFLGLGLAIDKREPEKKPEAVPSEQASAPAE